MREACYRQDDGASHDEAFHCEACGRPVCGYCAEPDGHEWLCPDCEPDSVNPNVIDAAGLRARTRATADGTEW